MDELIQKLIAAVMELIEEGEEIPDEVIDQITAILLNRIRQIQEEKPIESPGQQGTPPLQDSMASSNIHSYGYDDASGELRVKFNGKTEKDAGPVYSFGGVPPQIFDLFRKGAVPARTKGQNRWGKWWMGKRPSAGASFYTLIREAGYPHKRLS